MMSTDDSLFCIDCCRIAAAAWASGDLDLADKAFFAARVTVEQCGDFIDLYDDHQVGP
jgi:hypothetical protein